MATQLSNDAAEHLKYQTWVLRVSIHCEGCKKKVHKILHNIDGVFTVSIDSEKHKVSVKGNVEAEKLVKKLAKAGKHAEILQENVGEGEGKNKTGKSKKNKKKNKNIPDNVEKGTGEEDEDDQENKLEEKDGKIIDGNLEEKDDKSSDKNDAEDEKPNPTDDGGKKKKKKSKKGNNTEGVNAKNALATTESFPTALETVDPPIGMMHLGPPYGHVYPYYPAQTFGLSYNTSHPSGTSSYYALPAYAYNHTYARYLPPLSFDQIRGYNDYHRDEIYIKNDGEGGCSIM